MSENQSPSPAPIGDVLQQRYRVDSELGRGGMGAVYLARDIRLDRWVVVKIPKTELMGDPKLRQRFLAEVRDLSAHEHPHILAIQDFGEHEGAPFAVLQYLGGGDLSDRLKQAGGRMTAGEILAWLRPIALALDFIHSKGCLHRDVKPANIIFDEQGHPFLSDFGIATAIETIDSEAPTRAPHEQLTAMGSFIGSPAYAPPEAIDRVLTPAYDQYGLATVVYLALCGKLPFSGKTSEAILIAKSNTPPSPLPGETLREPLPTSCSGVLLKALSRDAADRFDSCLDFAQAFERESRAEPDRPRLKHVLLAVSVASVLLCGFLAWRWWPALPFRHSAPSSTETVELGSTAEEIAAALQLCREHMTSCDPAEFSDEVLHGHAVTAIAMDRFEVTNREFAGFVDETGLRTAAEQRGTSWDGPSRRSGLSWRVPAEDIAASEQPDYPVVHVSFEEAQRYCETQDGRLPSADEWEFQARGRERRVFPWGDEWSSARLRWVKSSAVGLEPVGSHAGGATPEGIEDLAGSVWEWTTSTVEGLRVIKGASWDDRNPAHFRAAAFAAVEPDTTSSDLGFRCVRER